MDNLHFIYQSNRNDNTTRLLDILSSKRIIFGHQSVGYNIIKGINMLEKESGIKLNIIESRELSKTKSPSFIHFQVGKNKDAFSKIDDFYNIMEDGSKESGSIAFFKFCYVDIGEEDNIDSVFKYYKEKMLDLKEKYPDTKLILFTVPLRALQKGPKAFIKKILLMPVGGVMDNINRARFNNKILEELADEFTIFDLAKVEATLPDGTTCTFTRKGKKYPCMPYIYTYDGGHLNDVGARIVAYNLIYFLTNEIK